MWQGYVDDTDALSLQTIWSKLEGLDQILAFKLNYIIKLIWIIKAIHLYNAR